MAYRRIERRPLVLLLAVAGTAISGFFAASSTALAEGSGEPSHPQPQELWHAYPLDAKATQGQPHKPRARVPSPSTTARESGGGPSSLLLWISLAAFAASLLAFAVSWRESLRLRRMRRALLLAGDNVRAFCRDLATGMRRLRPSRTSRLALIARRPNFRRTEPRQLAQVLTDVLHQRTATHPQNVDVGLHSVLSPREEPEGSDAAREREVLKQKRAAATSAEVRKLKEKTRAVASDTARRDEIRMLKAKLADSPESSPGAMLAARRVQKGER
jgi:hypothetical protein